MAFNPNNAVKYIEDEEPAIATASFDPATAQPFQERPKKSFGLMGTAAKLTNAPPETFIDTVKSRVSEFFNFRKTPEQNIAEGKNIYAISKEHNIPMQEVQKNIESLFRDHRITGLQSGLTNEEFTSIIVAPFIAQGLIAAPVATGLRLAGFTALDKLYNLKNFLPADASDSTKTAVGIADMISKGGISDSLAGGLEKNTPLVIGKLFSAMMDKFGHDPTSIKFSPQQINDIQSSDILKPEEKASLMENLGIEQKHVDASLNNNLPVSVPSNKLLDLTKEPYWDKAKEVMMGDQKDNLARDEQGKPIEINADVPRETSQKSKYLIDLEKNKAIVDKNIQIAEKSSPEEHTGRAISALIESKQQSLELAKRIETTKQIENVKNSEEAHIYGDSIKNDPQAIEEVKHQWELEKEKTVKLIEESQKAADSGDIAKSDAIDKQISDIVYGSKHRIHEIYQAATGNSLESGKPIDEKIRTDIQKSLKNSKGGQNAEGVGGQAQEGSGQQGTQGQTESGVHLRNDAQNRVETPTGEVKPPEPPTIIEGGQPNEKPHGLSVSVEEDAIAKGLIQDLGDLPTYKTRNMKEAAKRALNFINNDPVMAEEIAFGRAPEQGDVRAQELFSALKTKAENEGDVEMIKKLGLSKEAGAIGTELGQRVKAYDTNNPESPVAAVKDIVDTREKSAKEKGTKEPSKSEIKDLEDKLAKAEQELKTLKENKTSKRAVASKEFGSRNKLFTKEGLEEARKSLKDKLSGLHSGIDPTIIVEMTKIGGYYFEGGARDFSVWSKTMIEEFGNKIVPYLSEAWKNIKSEFGKAEKKALVEKIDASIKNKVELSAMSSDIQKLSENLIESGVKNRDDLINEMHKILKKSIPEITRREVMDAISGYGQFKPLSPGEIKAQLRDLKGQMQQIAKLEDLQNKKAPLKTGVERRTPSDEERRLIKLVDEAKKKYGIETTDPATQLKSSLDAIKTRLKNQISDLVKQINDNQKIVKEKRSVALDQEAKDLTLIRDELKSKFDQIFGKSELTDEQRIKIAISALEKSITNLEEKIKTGDISTNKNVSKTPQTPEIIKLKERREALKEELQGLRDLANPKKTPEEIALQSLKTRLENQSVELERRLKEADFSDKQKKELELDPQTLKKKNEVEQLRKAYNAAKVAKEKITTEEIQNISTLSKKVSETKSLVKENSPDRSPERLAYGRARVDFEDYVNNLKDEATKKSFIEFFKPQNILEGISNLAGLVKSLKASFDDSAVGRQGLKTLVTHPEVWLKNTAKSFADIWNTFGGKNVMREVRADILSRKNSLNGLYKKEKLAVGVMEEAYPIHISDKIPLIGKAYKASENAFTAFQYRTRADVFDKLVDVAEKSNADITGLGKLVNSLTGRGDLGALEPIAGKVNNFFFSPRFLKSNIDLLTMHAFDKNMGSFARKEAALNMVKVVGAIAAVLAIAKALDKDSVDYDPRSANFGKIKVGNTRFDVSGGMSSLVILAARLITQESKSSTTGHVTKVNSGKYGALRDKDLIYNFFENKLSPAASFVLKFHEKKDFSGKKITAVDRAKDLVEPLIISNFEDLKNDPNSANIIAAMLADFFGISTNTYSRKNAGIVDSRPKDNLARDAQGNKIEINAQ